MHEEMPPTSFLQGVVKLESRVAKDAMSLKRVRHSETSNELFCYLIEENPQLCGRIGLSSGDAREPLAALMATHGIIPTLVARILTQRVLIYLSIIPLLSKHDFASAEIAGIAYDLQSLISSLKYDEPVGRDLRVAFVAPAVRAHGLSWFRGTAIDSDLWVVLKTLYEDPTGGESNERRLMYKFIIDQLREDARHPGHIVEPRHAWWALTVLVSGSTDLLPGSLDLGPLVERSIGALLGRRNYIPPNDVMEASLVPELHNRDREEIWAAINMARLLKVSSPAIKPSVQQKLWFKLNDTARRILLQPEAADLLIDSLRLLLEYEYGLLIGYDRSAIEQADGAIHRDGTLTSSDGTSMKFFVSYTSKDRAWAEWIAWEIESLGHRVILQAWDFRPGNNFVLEMDRAIKESDRTLAVLSQKYMDALFTHPEWAAALAKDPTGVQQKLIPVRIEECQIDGLLAQTIYVDLAGLDENKARVGLQEGLNFDRNKPGKAPSFPGYRTGRRPFPGSSTS